jgi:nitrate reductase NapD
MQKSRPSRRALLTAQLTSHVSSAIVSVLPDRRISVLRRLAALPGVEVHHVEHFKIVIVLEADEVGAIGSRLAEISTWDGVLSANMVFEQADAQFDLGG